jgi:O-antigen ligase
MYSIGDAVAESPLAPAPSDAGEAALLRPEPPRARPLSTGPADTFDRLLQMVSFAALFFLVAWWSAHPQRALSLILAVTITGFVVSLFGLLQYLTWNGRIYWFRRIHSKAAFGPFVNHNHFAGYVGLVIPLAVCLSLYAFERSGAGGRRDEIASERWGRAGLALFAAALLVAALFFSMSRGGILASAIGGLALFVLVSRRVGSRLLVWSAAIVLVAVAVGFIAWIGADVVGSQLGTYRSIENEASFRFRTVVWRAMLENITPFLKTGSGLGTFEDSFAPFTPAGSAQRWDRAHNDYLQLLWETGVVGVLLFAVAAVIFIRRFWWASLRARQGPLSLFRVGLAISLLTISLHSIVDFNLQIGANGFLFALLAGLLVGLHRAAEEGSGTA